MNYITIGKHKFDPEDGVTCAVCGERFDSLDCEKVAGEYLCPACYGKKFNKWNRIVSIEMDEFDMEIVRDLIEGM